MTGQQQGFYSFILERVQEGKEEELKVLLNEGFKKQDEGTFTKEYYAETTSKMFALVRPECLEDLQKVSAVMTSQLEKQ